VIVLNFSHPLTPEQIGQIESLARQKMERVIEVAVHFDHHQPFGPQVVAAVDACGLSPTEWQTTPLVVVPPALNFIAVLLIAELHGRMGYFPPCVRLRPVEGAIPPRYEVAEVLDLQGQRESARRRR